MPDYKPTPWDKGETPKTDEFEIVSKDFGTRTIKVYVPKLVSPAGAIGLRQKRNIKTSSPKTFNHPLLQVVLTLCQFSTLKMAAITSTAERRSRSSKIL
jgi:hypothetical protein